MFLLSFRLGTKMFILSKVYLNLTSANVHIKPSILSYCAAYVVAWSPNRQLVKRSNHARLFDTLKIVTSAPRPVM